MIAIEPAGGHEWLVTISARLTTTHRVTVKPADLRRYAPGRTAEELLQASFRFLLARESNSSILRSFDLPVISSYFPSFEEEMRREFEA